MTELRESFAINSEDVAAKVIDGELIIIRLSDGTYYSMDNVGTRVWEMLGAGHDLQSVAATIAGWYAVPVPRVAGEVRSLVEELLEERLILAAERPAPTTPAPVPAELPAYETPRLGIYRDMGNLLALDPPTPGIDDLLFKDDKSG